MVHRHRSCAANTALQQFSESDASRWRLGTYFENGFHRRGRRWFRETDTGTVHHILQQFWNLDAEFLHISDDNLSKNLFSGPWRSYSICHLEWSSRSQTFTPDIGALYPPWKGARCKQCSVWCCSDACSEPGTLRSMLASAIFLCHERFSSVPNKMSSRPSDCHMVLVFLCTPCENKTNMESRITSKIVMWCLLC